MNDATSIESSNMSKWIISDKTWFLVILSYSKKEKAFSPTSLRHIIAVKAESMTILSYNYWIFHFQVKSFSVGMIEMFCLVYTHNELIRTGINVALSAA